MNHDVFISYSSRDKTTALAICHVLEEHRIRCWMAPRDIPPGADYGDVIDEAIVGCRLFVLVFSGPATLSQWVKGELNLAFTERKIIIPYRIDETPLTGAMRLILNQTHWIEAYSDAEARFGELVEATERFLGRLPTPEPIPEPSSEPVPDLKKPRVRTLVLAAVGLLVFVLAVIGFISLRSTASKSELTDRLDTCQIGDYSHAKEIAPKESVTSSKSGSSDAKADKAASDSQQKAEKAVVAQKDVPALNSSSPDAKISKVESGSQEKTTNSEGDAVAAISNASHLKMYEVGDYYHENGKEGIVFEVDATGRHGKIMVMHDLPKKLEWCTKEEWDVGVQKIGAVDQQDGMKNMEVVRRIPGWREKYPVFAACAVLGEGWYLPAKKELEKLCENRDYLSAQAEKFGGSPFVETLYWSSSECNSTNAWNVSFYNGQLNGYYKFLPYQVRAVAAF